MSEEKYNIVWHSLGLAHIFSGVGVEEKELSLDRAVNRCRILLRKNPRVVYYPALIVDEYRYVIIGLAFNINDFFIGDTKFTLEETSHTSHLMNLSELNAEYMPALLIGDISDLSESETSPESWVKGG